MREIKVGDVILVGCQFARRTRYRTHRVTKVTAKRIDGSWDRDTGQPATKQTYSWIVTDPKERAEAEKQFAAEAAFTEARKAEQARRESDPHWQAASELVRILSNLDAEDVMARWPRRSIERALNELATPNGSEE